MKLINSKNLNSKRDTYKLTKSVNNKVSDLDGQTVKVKAWAYFEDVDASGEMKEVLAIMSEDGDTYGTISPVFIREFLDIQEYFEGEPEGDVIEVFTGKTKAGRTFVSCRVG